jgi:leukotriene-A4 hydrolase
LFVFRSLANVVAHEIAHSWTGNLVTNANWEHFWLNEGFTVFFERKILGRLYGNDERDFALITGFEDEFLPEIYEHFSPVHEYTKLCPNLSGVDPDDAWSCVPYEKACFLNSKIVWYFRDQHFWCIWNKILDSINSRLCLKPT